MRRDFQALWNTQFFEDIRLEVEDNPDQPNGKIVVFYVQERPIIRRIEYKGNKSITESDILDAFKDRKVGLSVESQFDPTKIKRAEVVIKGLLAEHGHQFATVKPTYERIAATNAVKLVFNIDEGPKVKVGDDHLHWQQGVFRPARSSAPCATTARIAIPLYITDIPVLEQDVRSAKLDEDLEVGIRGLYQDNGYFKVVVSDPDLKTVDDEQGGIPGPLPLIGSKNGKRDRHHHPHRRGRAVPHGQAGFRSADPDKGWYSSPISGASLSAERRATSCRRTRSARRSRTTRSCTANTATSISWPRR